ncbi:hypothetical protein A7982_12476 [Minicystis rosea]|nr:hypothetical protein A7982_12476 [Minicystis rosea]
MENGLSLTFFPGRYSGPGREEMVVAMRGGCETGASSSHTDGARAVVRKLPGGWQRTFHRPGALGECTPIHASRTGRSRLVCRVVSGHMGLYYDTFSLIGFDEPEGETDERADTFLRLVSHDVAYLRAQTQGPLSVFVVQRFVVQGREEVQAGDDKALAVEIALRSSLDCAGGASGCPGVDRRTFDAALRFAFDGGTLRITPETRAAFDRVQARNDE